MMSKKDKKKSTIKEYFYTLKTGMICIADFGHQELFRNILAPHCKLFVLFIFKL